LLNIKYFQELAKSSDPEVIKHVVKKSKIVRPHSRKIVIAKDDPINYIYVIIKGKVGIEQDLYAGEQIVDQHKISRMFNVLEN
jgi:signal-transduction protein with cAMP-binding, CBS, and nucleotidyltransferase domain